ncbi:prenyltransferase/squalene oxidase repeat-containing protein [Cellvibrio sp. PSBB006]|uniref:prenyltransferase/squalene oxidase repeat-containing protein n=1 Tax=Cellvibrio sp. PSBB006 TaxID=1987723 RepID=UPI000B3BA743|nr:prenyltransferase/squalene oxidase repeat-containing protein [Cellvibrio sp. PSBB006]ARU28717.1 prenyltransferase [Cellvibrio sp. PSBB006]
MNELLLSKGFFPESLLRPTVNYILQTQLPNGCIPWFPNGKADPWDHIEATMGLTIGGEYTAAQRAYRWLANEQLADGSWWANYYADQPVDRNHRETNFIAYIATGLWHYFLVTEDKAFLVELFPCVERAIDFVLRYQSPTGEIYWAVAEDGSPKEDALVTACASIYKSLECANAIADTLVIDKPTWRKAQIRLGKTLREHPECFDRTWESKERFSMDWFYPILTGVISGKAAQQRIDKKWSLFVENNIGCRCVSDEPWVTVAESCELTLALLAAGDHARALHLFSWLHQFMDEDGGYWTGYNFRDKVIWPKEKTTWTAGAILLAADALIEHTGAAHLFTKAVETPNTIENNFLHK